jgi:hypothetical protein
MKTTRKPPMAGTTAMAAALTLALTAGAATAADPHYDRAFMLAADARCGLFDRPVTAALASATLQARGAALREGATAIQAAETARRARARAAAVDCSNPELRMVAGRVQNAFSGWASMRRMDFPGVKGVWMADRTAWDAPRWRLSQAGRVGASPVTVGRASGHDGLTVAVSFFGRPRPTSARIVARDAARFPNPWIARTPTLAPEAQRRALWAGATFAADRGLLATGKRQGEVWRFEASALSVLAGLDPREAFAVEFLFRDGSVARVEFEVGDLAAAEAFLSLGAV